MRLICPTCLRSLEGCSCEPMTVVELTEEDPLGEAGNPKPASSREPARSRSISMTRVFTIALIAVSIVLLAKLVVAQDVNALRQAIADDIVDNNTGEISPADVRGVLYDIADLLVTVTQVQGEIAPWARFRPVGTIANNVLPNYLRTGIYQPVAPWAQLLFGSGTAPFARLPFPDCSQGQILERGPSAWACAAQTGGGGGGNTLDNAGVRDQVATMLLAGPNLGYTRTGTGATQTLTLAMSGTLPFTRLPFPDCTNGQILERGATGWTCGADDIGGTGGGLTTAQVRSQVSTMLLTGTNIGLTRSGTGASQTVTIGLTGTIPDANIPAGIARVTALPAAPASWALGTSPTGTAPANRLATGPANGEFLQATGLTTSEWSFIQESDIPAAIARDAEIETWAVQASTGASAIIPAIVVSNDITRDAEIPSALFAGANGWSRAAAGECLKVIAGTTTATRTSFDWEDCGTGGGGNTPMSGGTGFRATLLASGTTTSTNQTFSNIILPTTGWLMFTARATQRQSSTIMQASEVTNSQFAYIFIRYGSSLGSTHRILFARSGTVTNALQVIGSQGVAFSVYTLASGAGDAEVNRAWSLTSDARNSISSTSRWTPWNTPTSTGWTSPVFGASEAGTVQLQCNGVIGFEATRTAAHAMIQTRFQYNPSGTANAGYTTIAGSEGTAVAKVTATGLLRNGDEGFNKEKYSETYVLDIASGGTIRMQWRGYGSGSVTMVLNSGSGCRIYRQ